MADVPQRLKPPHSPNSLAEMAAKAAQRQVSNRPPPPPPLHAPSAPPGYGAGPSYPPAYSQAPSYAPPPGHASSRTGGSGLIHLHNLQPPPTIAPVLQNIEVQRVSGPPRGRRARLESNPFESKGSRGLFVGFIVGLLVIGAAYGLAMRKGINPIAAGRNLIASLRNWDAPPTPPQFSVAETKPAGGDTAAANAPKAAAETAAPTVRGLDPAKLPAVGAQPVAPAEATDVLADSKSGARLATKPAARTAPEPAAPRAEPKPEPPAPKPAPPPVAKAEPKPEPPPPPAAPEPAPNSLAGAIKKAVGPQEAAPKAVAAEAPEVPAVRGDIPEVPPQGAITGALGSPRQAARACIEGQDASSRATIVFGSNGHVQNVNVSGPAAGTRAEGCISKALSRAVVGPFRRPTYSLTVTISPN
jgi:hypothetical protein